MKRILRRHVVATVACFSALGCSVEEASPSPCDLPHASSTRADDGCRIESCEEGFADCNLEPTDGCETETRADPQNCGACEVECDLPHASSSCQQGQCRLVGCEAGWADCDANPTSGCEAELDKSILHCGSCDNACSYPNASALCSGGTCAMGACDAGWVNCDANSENGCEANTSSSVANCGTCGHACTFVHASASCQSGVCVMGACEGGWKDCDASPSTGCETDVATSLQHCGACGTACGFANAPASCEQGACVMGSCEDDWGDCDGDPATGCEQALDSSSHCGACGRDCLGGACIDAKCYPAVLASGQSTPWAIAVDATHVYWSTHTWTGAIRRVPKSGGFTQTLASNQAIPDGIELTSTHVIWANDADDLIQSVPLAGGTIETLASVPSNRPVDVAVTDTHVFWTNWAANSVQRVALAGGAVEDVSTSDNHLSHRIVTDGSHVWWTNIGNHTVRRATVEGGDVTTIATGSSPLGIAVDATQVCWTNSGDKTIVCAPLGGGAPETLTTAPAAPHGMAMDDTHVYWADGSPTSSIRRADRATGTTETLAVDQDDTVYVALDEDAVYWANSGSGEILRLAK